MNKQFILPANASHLDYREWAYEFRQSETNCAKLEISPQTAKPGSLIALNIKISLPKQDISEYSHLVLSLPFWSLRFSTLLQDGALLIPKNTTAQFNWPALEIKLPTNGFTSSIDIKIPKFKVPLRPGLFDIEAFIKKQSGNFKLISSRQYFEVLDSPVEELQVYGSNNFSDDKIRFSVVAEQAEINQFMPDRNCEKSFCIDLNGHKSNHKFNAADGGIKKLEVPAQSKPVAIKAFFIPDGKIAVSNLLIPQFMQDDNCQIYFGDMHTHSHESDGTGSAEEMMHYARDWKRLDFFALNEHIEQRLSWTTWDVAKWQRIKQINEDFNKTNEFVTIPGFEYRSYCNLWCFDDEYIQYNTPEFHGDADHPVAILPGLPGAKSLQNAIQQQIKEFTKKRNWLVGYHRLETMLDLFGKAPVPVHLLQLAHGRRPPETGSEIFLERGDKVGFFGATDTHQGIPGQVFSGPHDGQSGLTAVIAPELSRSSLHTALRERYCYATMGSRTLVKFTLNDYRMGEAVKLQMGEPIKIEVKVAGKEIIDKIEFVRSGETVFSKEIGKTETITKWSDTTPITKSEYFFARIHLMDKRKIWTSPVFVSIIH